MGCSFCFFFFSFAFLSLSFKYYMALVTVSSSGVGVAHLPNQKHRIVSKKGAHFTLMVCGKMTSSRVFENQEN
jgi:hypothetical protein